MRGDGESPNLELVAQKFGIDMESVRSRVNKRSQLSPGTTMNSM